MHQLTYSPLLVRPIILFQLFRSFVFFHGLLVRPFVRYLVLQFVRSSVGRWPNLSFVCSFRRLSVCLYARIKTRRNMEYDDRLKILNWPTLERRRHSICLVECCKTVFGLNGLNFSDFFELALDTWTRANDHFNLFVKSAKVNSYK